MSQRIAKQTGQRLQTAVPPMSSVLQRKCATCGNHTMTGGKCEACKDKGEGVLQRAAAGSEAMNVAPPIVHEVLRSPGQPLDASTRAFMEPRFGHDFSGVRLHIDARAAQSAQAVNALAYTVGRNIVFGAGQYAPGGTGQRTLAHELAHVVQQSGSSQSLQGKYQAGPENSPQQPKSQGTTKLVAVTDNALHIGQSGDAYEQEADSVAEAVMQGVGPPLQGSVAAAGLVQRTTVPLLQRRLVVNPADFVPLPAGFSGPPTPLTHAVQGLIDDTCPDGHFQVNGTTGVVTPQHAEFCQQPPPPGPWMTADVSSTPVGCGCICDTINHARTTTIAFRAGAPGTTPVGPTGTGPGSPTVRADPRFQGQYLINGRWVDIPFHLIFAHEVCGHALPLMRGTQVAPGPGPAGGTPPHERHAVDVERRIAAEHNPPLPRRPEDYAGAARQRP